MNDFAEWLLSSIHCGLLGILLRSLQETACRTLERVDDSNYYFYCAHNFFAGLLSSARKVNLPNWVKVLHHTKIIGARLDSGVCGLVVEFHTLFKDLKQPHWIEGANKRLPSGTILS